MNKLSLIILGVIAMIGASFLTVDAEDALSDKVVVYYFHGAFRCHTCNMMEKYSKEAVDANFQEALRLGRVEFRAVNVEMRGNEHYMKDYQLYTKSLLLSFVKDGREIKYKNLDRIWQFAGNKQKFIDYVKSEIDSFIKDMR